jgi:hypothetical protein
VVVFEKKTNHELVEAAFATLDMDHPGPGGGGKGGSRPRSRVERMSVEVSESRHT